MRLIWNAGAALAVTTMMTLATTLLASGESHPAIARPVMISQTSHRHYTGLAEHFRAANTTDDGKLTLDQAKQDGWTRVIRHFDEIDATHAGFVTLAEIHTYNIAHRHSRKDSST